jgi:hypothetical protein
MSKVDSNNVHLSDEAIHDLLIYYAMTDKLAKFVSLYEFVYKKSPVQEANMCFYFSRLALGLNPDTRNVY